MSRLREQFRVGEVFTYFIRVFQKPKPGAPANFNIRAMHTINKISILMFLVCLIVMIYRAFLR
ncbi:DUF6728 family protein [Aquirufa sp.]|jgi:hypothetical protein|uniref:DUF6728 family protein n=1 Tax=Aquirufa sp. TaxID=2676249 RepID=UPI0037833090